MLVSLGFVQSDGHRRQPEQQQWQQEAPYHVTILVHTSRIQTMSPTNATLACLQLGSHVPQSFIPAKAVAETQHLRPVASKI